MKLIVIAILLILTAIAGFYASKEVREKHRTGEISATSTVFLESEDY